MQVSYSGVMRATDVATRRAQARVWVVRCDTTERQPRTCEWDRAVARYLAFNGRRSGARFRAGGDDATPTHEHGPGSFLLLLLLQRPPAYRTIKLASRGGECESVVYQIDTRSTCEPFAFNRRQLLVP